MEITVKELLELTPQLNNNIKIKIENSGSVTLRAKTKGNSDVLLKAFEMDYNGDSILIDKLGLYTCNNLKIWVVKE